jgi:hypothetical protein
MAIVVYHPILSEKKKGSGREKTIFFEKFLEGLNRAGLPVFYRYKKAAVISMAKDVSPRWDLNIFKAR